MDLYERARKYVEKMPAAESGNGGHNATFHAACILVQGFGFTPEQAFSLLGEFNQRCSPPWTEKELWHKLRQADKTSSKRGRGWLARCSDWQPGEDWKKANNLTDIAPAKPQYDAAKLARFAGAWAGQVDLVWLANRSAMDPATVSADLFLRTLYGDGEKVAVLTEEFAGTIGRGLTMWPDTAPPERGPEPKPCGVWFFAQPVDGKYHPGDEDGKTSCRNYRAVMAWRYLVIESDSAPTRQWLGAVAQLPLRIAALYTSGGRSVHALVRVDAPTKAEWDAERDRMKTPLTVLGADPKTLTAVRLTRLPGCLRHGKMEQYTDTDGKKRRRYNRFARPKLQKLLYINPNPPLAPLVDLFARRDVVKHWCDLAAAGVADSDETGGAWLKRGLEYYAGVSTDVEAALQEWEAAQ